VADGIVYTKSLLTCNSRACSKFGRRVRNTCTIRPAFDDIRHIAGKKRASRVPGRRATWTGRGSDPGNRHRSTSSSLSSVATRQRRQSQSSPAHAFRNSHSLRGKRTRYNRNKTRRV